MRELASQENWGETLDIGLDWLNDCPIDLRVHSYTALSYMRSGQEAEAVVHKQWINGVMDSIETEQGEEFTIYFNPAAHFARLGNLF